jgi:hypothetical protein
MDIAFDSEGNTYISTYGHSTTGIYMIVRIDKATGVIETYAGTGARGYSGDGGPATAADIQARGLAFDAEDNLYFSGGTTTMVIRRVIKATGIVETVAGTGENGCCFAPGASAADNAGCSGSPALSTKICYSWGGPAPIRFDKDGNLLFTQRYAVRKLVIATGVIETFAGTGTTSKGENIPATEAEIKGVWGIAVDSKGNVFFNEYYNYLVRRVDKDTGYITTISTAFVPPVGLALDGDDNMFVNANGGKVEVCRIPKKDDGTYDFANMVHVAGKKGGYTYGGDGGPATDALLQNSYNVFIDPNGMLLIGDLSNHVVRGVTPP